MSNYRRTTCQGATFFFTVVTYKRRKILCTENLRQALREGLRETKTAHPFVIDAWVLLPDHIHCVWTLPPNDADFGLRWAKIKRHVTKRCTDDFHNNSLMTSSKLRRKESTIWQRRFWEHQIRDEQDYLTHLDYIHFNPVKHGYVRNVSDWKYSTFHSYVRREHYPSNWGSNIIETPLENYGE